MIAAGTAKGGVTSKRGRKKPRSVAPAGKSRPKSGTKSYSFKRFTKSSTTSSCSPEYGSS